MEECGSDQMCLFFLSALVTCSVYRCSRALRIAEASGWRVRILSNIVERYREHRERRNENGSLLMSLTFFKTLDGSSTTLGRVIRVDLTSSPDQLTSPAVWGAGVNLLPWSDHAELFTRPDGRAWYYKVEVSHLSPQQAVLLRAFLGRLLVQARSETNSGAHTLKLKVSCPISARISAIYNAVTSQTKAVTTRAYPAVGSMWQLRPVRLAANGATDIKCH